MSEAAVLTKKDFQSDQDVRWCPGCGDYAILSAVQSVMPELGIPKERFVVVSGIGCSSRFPYYMNTYGFHTIHGRAPGFATGLKATRPDLEVWVVTGDGDAMSIGGNHFIHLLRRNVGLKILMFNNRIYGLTKGQSSPTSELGKKTKSTPFGSIDAPFDPISLALGAGATFVARSIDVFLPHLKATLLAAAAHRGTAFVEIFQNCNIFNDGAWAHLTEKERREAAILELEHGKPVVWGPEGARRGLRLGNDLQLEEVAILDPADELRCITWDTTRQDPSMAFMLSHHGGPSAPTPIGVFRSVQGPVWDEQLRLQTESELDRKGPGSLDELLRSGETWTVAEDGSIR
jgi:2-oxoglutarate ferredoxin oxidoreductase subunit beta